MSTYIVRFVADEIEADSPQEAAAIIAAFVRDEAVELHFSVRERGEAAWSPVVVPQVADMESTR